MTSKKIRVLIVDDSALIREIISDFVSEQSDMEVAGTAVDGRDAVRMFGQVNPDVVTLDVQMPIMDGLETLGKILAKRPVPVIMVSAQTKLGADVTLKALDQGALDYVAKPDGMLGAKECLGGDLMRKIRTMAGTDVASVLQKRRQRVVDREERRKKNKLATQSRVIAKPQESEHSKHLADKVIVIGISTGGPPALTSLFESLSTPVPPIVIVQHMPANFTGPFAERLNTLTDITVKEAATGDCLEPNHAYVAPGGYHLHVRRFGKTGKLLVQDGELVSGHKPSADVMFETVAQLYGDRCLALIMTGMGRDGADGCGEIKAAGGYVLGQDQASSDVYGMNKVAFIEGHVDRQFSLDEAAGNIIIQMKRLWAPTLTSASG